MEIVVGLIWALFYVPLFLLIGAIGWAWETLVANALLIGVLCVVGAALSTILLFVPALRMSRGERTWQGVLRWLLIFFAAVVSLVFAGVAIIGFAVAIYF